MRRLLLSAVLAAIAGFWTHAASAGGFLSDLEARACEDPHILATIVDRFRYQVHNVPHLPIVGIREFRGIHEHRYLPYREDRPIARRYCGATADLSDGRSRTIWFLIEDGMGLAGMGDNVEFCVAGFDRWMVYNGACRVLR
jgi:hypothetical protein